MRPNPIRGGAKGCRPHSKLTTDQTLWIIEVCTTYVPLVMKMADHQLSRQDAEDIVANEREIIITKGIQDLYSKKIQLEIEQGVMPSREKTLGFLKFHLNRRIAEFFRTKKTTKRGYVPSKCDCGESTCICEDRSDGWHRICEVSDHVVAAVPDEAAGRALDGITARSDLDYVYAKALPTLNETDKILYAAARRNPAGGFNRSSLYEAMTEHEREYFQPEANIPIIDEEEAIKCTIASRTGELCRKLRRSVSDEWENFAVYSA